MAYPQVVKRQHAYFVGALYLPNLRVKCDKHPADYCVIFDCSEVISVFDFVVGAYALRE